MSGLFLIGYGSFRFLIEYAREPDSFLGVLAMGMSMGQWLSLPMILGAIMDHFTSGQPVLAGGAAGGEGEGADEDDEITGINVTPLVDIVLVLLIIFMVTAPLLNLGVDIQLPQSKAKSPPPPTDRCAS